jgi:hypothetical protein
METGLIPIGNAAVVVWQGIKRTLAGCRWNRGRRHLPFGVRLNPEGADSGSGSSDYDSEPPARLDWDPGIGLCYAWGSPARSGGPNWSHSTWETCSSPVTGW